MSKVFSILFTAFLIMPWFSGVRANGWEGKKIPLHTVAVAQEKNALKPGEAIDPKAGLKSANEAFEAENYTAAMEQYTLLYDQGNYSEQMLYRLSFMHENLGNFPAAIYYLKKARQEFGGETIDNKVKQLMLKQGGSRQFSASGWDRYHRIFNQWRMLVWILFGLCGAGLLVFFYLNWSTGKAWKRVTTGLTISFFMLTLGVLTYDSFFVPQRAVIVEPTSFYLAPGYSAASNTTALSIGETVNITEKQDIWVKIEAGVESWWVPNFVIKEL